jgi:hypothetical protein
VIRTALQVFRGLLPILERVLGLDHSYTRLSKKMIAHWDDTGPDPLLTALAR